MLTIKAQEKSTNYSLPLWQRPILLKYQFVCGMDKLILVLILVTDNSSHRIYIISCKTDLIPKTRMIGFIKAKYMNDSSKTKKQLIEELSALRRRVTWLNGSEASSIHEAHYRSMVEASPVSIMAIRNGRLLFSNPAGARMLGFSHPNEMVGKLAIEVVAHESQQLVTERINRLGSGKDNPAEEIMLIRQDGTKITVETISVPINIDGILTAVIIAHDVSKRKELETKLIESEERFRAFMDNIPASVYIKDENDIHIYANAAASESTKKKLEELVGSTTRELWPSDLADRLIELDQKVIDKGVPKITEEWKIREKGDARWQRDIKFPII